MIKFDLIEITSFRKLHCLMNPRYLGCDVSICKSLGLWLIWDWKLSFRRIEPKTTGETICLSFKKSSRTRIQHELCCHLLLMGRKSYLLIIHQKSSSEGLVLEFEMWRHFGTKPKLKSFTLCNCVWLHWLCVIVWFTLTLNFWY